MVREELIKKSPLRILEKSTHGGVGKGNIGVIAARKGVGKTACLVHIATDQLFQDKHVIHVSFASSTQHIINWYEEIFTEIAKRRNLESAMDVHDKIIRNRVIMNFNQDGVRIAQVISSIKSLIENGAFAADCIIVDGYNFAKSSNADLALFQAAAAELGLEFWFSASLRGEEGKIGQDGIPVILQPFLAQIAILIMLQSDNDMIHLHLAKDHEDKITEDLHLKLDPKVLLITRE